MARANHGLVLVVLQCGDDRRDPIKVHDLHGALLWGDTRATPHLHPARREASKPKRIGEHGWKHFLAITAVVVLSGSSRLRPSLPKCGDRRPT